jgi:hypothetical protein
MLFGATEAVRLRKGLTTGGTFSVHGRILERALAKAARRRTRRHDERGAPPTWTRWSRSRSPAPRPPMMLDTRTSLPGDCDP